MDRHALTAAIRAHALDDLGFDLVGVAPIERLEREGAFYAEWIAQGRHGSMEWMERNLERRIDPRVSFPAARSAIVVARNYYTPHEHASSEEAAKVSRYAWGRDYHNILPKRLKRLHGFITTLVPSAESRWFVDTGPVLEKQWAVRAGLGWMGRHTNVITRSHGSWVFLGVLFTSVDLEYDSPIPDFCGSCTACLDACPTGALDAPYRIDATRCLSYITIEQKPKEEIPLEIASKMEGWIFGCDICQDVCPWNRFQKPTDEPDFEPRPGLTSLTISEIRSMSDDEIRERFQGSPVRRATAEGLRRNAEGLARGKGSTSR